MARGDDRGGRTDDRRSHRGWRGRGPFLARCSDRCRERSLRARRRPRSHLHPSQRPGAPRGAVARDGRRRAVRRLRRGGQISHPRARPRAGADQPLDAHGSDVVCDLVLPSARSLQVGLPIEVIAITSVTANLAAILGGILVFGESIGSGAVGIPARLLAFLLVIAGAAMISAPLRLKPSQPDRDPDDQSDRDEAHPAATTHGRPRRGHAGRRNARTL